MKILLPIAALLLIVIAGSSKAQKKQTRPAASPHSAIAPNKAPGGGLASSMTNGKAIYTKYCLTCHQVDGYGVQNMNPPLIKTTYVLGDKTTLVSILQNGFKERVEINDDTYSNVMPAFDYLKDQEIADVLTYVRNSFGNKASAVTLKEVTTIRPKVKK